MKYTTLFLAALLIVTSLFIHKTTYSQEADSLNIWEMSLEELQNVKISSVSKSEQLLTDAPGIATVITAKEIENMGARNLEDILRTVVGMDIIEKPFQPLSYIGIRGMYSTGSNNKIKIMLNGHTLESSVGDPFFHINSIPVKNIQQIEIIQGPGSALYGTNAFLGVINIITKQEADPLKISTSGGSFGTIKQTAEVSFKKTKSSFYLYSDYYQTQGPSLLINADNATRLFGSTYSSSPGNTTEASRYFTVQPSFTIGNLSFTGFLQSLTTECPIGGSLALTNGDDIKSYIAFGEMKYQVPVSTRLKLEIKAYTDYYYYDGLYEIFSEKTAQLFSQNYPETPYPEDQGVNLLFNSKLLVLGAEVTADYKPIDGISFLGGLSYEYLDQYGVKLHANANTSGRPLTFDSITYLPFQYYGEMRDVSEVANWNKDVSRVIMAGFGQAAFDLNKLVSINNKYSKSLILTLGGRYDNYSDVGSSFNPRIGLVYSPYKLLHFKFLYGKAFRAPFFHELFQANNSISFGNTNLKPENIYTWEAQVNYQFSKYIQWTFTYFMNHMQQLILRDETGEYRNFGSYHVTGIEAGIRITATSKKYAFMNMSFVNVKNTTHELVTYHDSISYTQTDLHSGRNPAFIFNVGGNYDVTKHVMANVALNYTSERLRSEFEAFNSTGQLYRVDQRTPVTDRVLLNATFTFTKIIKPLPDLMFQVSGYNLLNANHRDPEDSGVVPNDIPRAGRSFMARITYTFK